MSSLVEVVVRGRPGAELVDALHGFEVRTGDDGLTRIVGLVVDQPRLLGMLQAMGDLHIEVVSVNPVDATTAVSPPEGDAVPSEAH
jgi:hypothetical protein